MRARAMSGDGDDDGLVIYGDFVGGGGLQLANRVGANREQRLVCDWIAIQRVSADKGMRKVAAQIDPARVIGPEGSSTGCIAPYFSREVREVAHFKERVGKRAVS